MPVKKKKEAIWLRSTSGLYWMLAEGVLEYAVVSGLVILEQSCQGSSFSGLLASPCVPVWYRKVCFIVNSATCTVHTYRELKLRYSLTPWCIQITLNTNSRTQKYR